MKKRIFSPRLFWDGIKQLRIIGILSTVALCFIGMITPIMQYLNQLDSSWTREPDTVNYLDMNMPIILLFCAIAPLMTLYLFSFLNKRDSSDFYHAIPETRQCLFLSLFASIITWLTFIAVVSAAVITIVYAALPALYTVNLSSVFITGFSSLVGSYLIAAGVAVAMCVTGTVFSNILVSLLLIFLPRLLIQIAVLAVTDALPLVSGLSFAAVLNYEYNVPVGFIFGLLFGDYEKALTSVASGIYTLVIAVIFTVIALILFVKRSSESAGKSAPNRALQAIYRFLIGSVLTAVAVFGLFDTVVQGDYLDASMIGTLVILFVISVLLALVFQVITAHSFKHLPRYALGMIVSLLLFGGVYFGGIYGLYHTTMSFSPQPEQIESVRILSGNGYGRLSDYFTSKTEQMELTDENAKRIVSEQLAYSLELLETSHDRYWSSGLPSVPVAIKCNGITHLRNVLISSEQLQSVYSEIYKTEEFRNVYTDLPETVSDIFVTNGYGDVHSYEALYKVLLEEVREIGFDKWFALQTASDEEYPEYYYTAGTLSSPTVNRLDCRFYEGMQWYEINVPLDASVLPKTTQEYIDQNCRAKQNGQELIDILKAKEFGKNDSLQVNFYNFGGEVPFGSVYVNEELTDNADSVAAWADTLSANTIPDVTKPFYFVTFEDSKIVYTDNGKDYWHETDTYWHFFQGDTLPDWLLELYEQQSDSDTTEEKY